VGGERSSVVSIATRLRTAKSGVRISVVARGFLFSGNVQTGSGAHQPPIQVVLGFFLGVKQPEREVNYLLPSSAELKYEWSYTSAPPICLYGVGRENCTFMWAWKNIGRGCPRIGCAGNIWA
jgi:hypothetical protein